MKSPAANLIHIILVRPENMANVGAVARAMKNTGFEKLRVVGLSPFSPEAFRLAVHAEEILKKATFYPDVAKAVGDLQVVFASTAKRRKNFTLISLEEAIKKIVKLPPGVKIGLLFGPERTGLESHDLEWANHCFVIPQASRQPSYNLAGAVLLTLFLLFKEIRSAEGLSFLSFSSSEEAPLPVAQQKECLRLIMEKLRASGFIHLTNKKHIEERLHDLFGRLQLTEKDRKLLLALFSEIPYHF